MFCIHQPVAARLTGRCVRTASRPPVNAPVDREFQVDDATFAPTESTFSPADAQVRRADTNIINGFCMQPMRALGDLFYCPELSDKRALNPLTVDPINA